MAQVIRLQNGLRIVIEPISTVRTVAVGMWVGAGSIHEQGRLNGISHFTEHMLFKGTKTKTAFEIADSFERLGAHVNAFTGKESTCYYYRCVDEYNKACFSVLADLFCDSIFDDVEMDRERGVVIEEINMVEDTPEDLCFDLLAKAVFGEHALGQTILGSIDNIKGFTSQDIRDYMHKYYSPSNVVVSFAGNITAQQAQELVQEYLYDKLPKNSPKIEYAPATHAQPSILTRFKDTELSSIALRFPSYPINHQHAYEVSIINSIMGASMSSRLFQTVREKMGLAYSVYSVPSAYRHTGSFILFMSVSPANTQRAMDAVLQEIQLLLRDGFTQAEFERAKTQIKSAFVFGQESTQTTMNAIGKLMLMADTLFDVNTRIAQINSVTMDSTMQVAHELLDIQKMSGAYLGKDPKLDLNKLVYKS